VSVVPNKAKLFRELKVSLLSIALVITLGIDRTLPNLHGKFQLHGRC